MKLLSLGMNAAILRYSLIPDEFPCALYEAAYAVRYLREHAKEWDCDPDKIIIAGFSAGGHVAASLGTMWNSKELEGFVKEYLHTEPEMIRPDGMLLGYPVITSGEKAHRKSFSERSWDIVMSSCLKVYHWKNVTKDTPQTFLWHTVTDGAVPVVVPTRLQTYCKKNILDLNCTFFHTVITDLDLERGKQIPQTEHISSRKYPSGRNYLQRGWKIYKKEWRLV